MNTTWNCSCHFENDNHWSPKFCGQCGKSRPKPVVEINATTQQLIFDLFNLTNQYGPDECWGSALGENTPEKQQRGLKVLTAVRELLDVPHLIEVLAERDQAILALRKDRGEQQHKMAVLENQLDNRNRGLDHQISENRKLEAKIDELKSQMFLCCEENERLKRKLADVNDLRDKITKLGETLNAVYFATPTT